jgi:hypothetical protein
MGAVDWWAKKLGTERPAPTSTPDTWNLPRHMPPTPAHQMPQQSYVPPSNALVADENGQVHVGDAIMYWQGGEGTKEGLHCPRCAAKGKKSNLMFGRTHGQGQKLGLINKSGQHCSPAPICFSCGYNGLYEPFGGDLNDMVG